MLRMRFKLTHLALAALFGLFGLLLYGPILVVFILSFQGENGGLTFPLRGVSLRWFHSLFFEQQLSGQFWPALVRSLALAIVVAIATLAISFLAGLAFRRNFRGATTLFYLTIASLVTPSILVSLGIGVLYSVLGIPKGTFSSGLGVHLTWTLPVGVLVMFSVFARFDRRLEEAAHDAGAGPFMTVREIIVPIILPSLIGVAILGLTLSYDEFARSLLTMGIQNTLPLELFAMTTNVTSPAIYALGTITTLVSFSILGAGGMTVYILRRKRRT
jgi:putative spermidine/putrescine transport system permease protein